MARTCVVFAELDPEDAFKRVAATVDGSFGVMLMAQNRLKFEFEPEAEEKDALPSTLANHANSFIKPFLSTLAWVTNIGVGYQLVDLEYFVDGKSKRILMLDRPRSEAEVDSSALSSIQDLLPLVLEDAHLRWALEDYRTALRERDHQVIFLYRCIEWLKVRFDGWEKAWKAIGSSEKEFRGIKKPANDYYLARHAQKAGPRPVPEQVRDKALKKTKTILQRYIDYLRSQAINRT